MLSSKRHLDRFREEPDELRDRWDELREREEELRERVVEDVESRDMLDALRGIEGRRSGVLYPSSCCCGNGRGCENESCASNGGGAQLESGRDAAAARRLSTNALTA